MGGGLESEAMGMGGGEELALPPLNRYVHLANLRKGIPKISSGVCGKTVIAL